jgi:anti-sigma factor RsiW
VTSVDCTTLSFDRLVDYTAGELPANDERRMEAHYFECRRCARRLVVVEALAGGVGALVRHGAARASVTREVVRRIAQEGLALRRYALAPGHVVPCTAAPTDDFVLVELRGLVGAGAGARVDVETMVSPSGATSHHTLLTSVDPESRSILMLFPAEVVRSYPRSRWTIRASVGGAPEAAAASYVLDHTPWAELADGQPPPG